jgi:hypothetical protein
VQVGCASRSRGSDSLKGGFWSVVEVFDELAVDEGRSCADEDDEVGCVDRPPGVWPDSMSLNAMASRRPVNQVPW